MLKMRILKSLIFHSSTIWGTITGERWPNQCTMSNSGLYWWGKQCKLDVIVAFIRGIPTQSVFNLQEWGENLSKDSYWWSCIPLTQALPHLLPETFPINQRLESTFQLYVNRKDVHYILRCPPQSTRITRFTRFTRFTRITFLNVHYNINRS